MIFLAQSNECPDSSPTKISKWCHMKCLNLLRGNSPLTQHIYQGGEGGENSKLSITAAILLRPSLWRSACAGSSDFLILGFRAILEINYSCKELLQLPRCIQRVESNPLTSLGKETSSTSGGKNRVKKSQCCSQEFRYLQSNQKIKERSWGKKIKEKRNKNNY